MQKWAEVAAAVTLHTVHPRFQMSTACVSGRLKTNSGGCSERGVYIVFGGLEAKKAVTSAVVSASKRTVTTRELHTRAEINELDVATVKV